MEADTAHEAAQQARFSPTPDPTPPAGETTPEAAPVEQPSPAPAPEATPAADSPSLFDGTPINPDDLPPELQPLAKQLQAAFTQKTQAHAENVKQLEALGSLEELEQAVELANRLADPNNWPQIHANLTAALEEQGLTPAQAQAEATAQIEAAQTPGLEALDDPDLAPIAAELKAQRAEIAAMKAARENEQAEAAASRQREEMLSQLSSMENAIKTANPHYEGEDMDYVYKLGAFHETNLIEAQKDFEAIGARAVERYIAAKTATPGSVAPAPAHAPAVSATSDEDKSMAQIASELEEHMRALQAAGELDGEL